MKTLLCGFTVGIISPLIGVFLYSQLSTSVGDVLLLPVYMLSGIFDEPFWYLSFEKQILLFLICGLIYASFIGYLEIASKQFREN
ncbi:hypothetical protein ACMC56_07035 [Campylobacterota bacterium DY0563]